MNTEKTAKYVRPVMTDERKKEFATKMIEARKRAKEVREDLAKQSLTSANIQPADAETNAPKPKPTKPLPKKRARKETDKTLKRQAHIPDEKEE